MDESLTYALDINNNLVFIDDVENGVKCGCHCPNPECCAPLNARNNGKKRNHHFAHVNGLFCNGAFESQLHLLAKEILQDTGQIMLPFSSDENFPSGLVKIHSIEVEKYDKLYNIKPDVEGILENGERLLIEFFVTHRVNDKKHKTIVENNLKCVEIDINYTILKRPQLKEFLIGTSKGRKWIVDDESTIPKEKNDTSYYPKKQNPLYEEARDVLKEIFDKGTLIIHPFYKMQGHIDSSFDLRKYKYDICELEADYYGFKSDLLLYRSNKEDPGHISINIRGSRRKKGFEYPHELRVIDIVISPIASINSLKSVWGKGNLVDSSYATFYYAGFRENKKKYAPNFLERESIVIENTLCDKGKSINKEEKQRALAFINSRNWTRFKLIQFCRKPENGDVKEFLWFAQFIRSHNCSHKKSKEMSCYELFFYGYKYWWSGVSIEGCTLINREKIKRATF